jgi:hypothetical protein
MKNLFYLWLLVFSTQLWANGHSISGKVSINGVLRSKLLRSKIPLGSVASFHGYEAIQIGSGTTVYCMGGVGLSSSGGIIGLSFGGEASNVTTVGRCEKAQDYTGGFLSIGLDYEVRGKGTQSLTVQGSANLSFDLENFNQQILDFQRYSPHRRSLQKRLFDVSWHLVKYAARSNSKKLGKDHTWLKLLLLPVLPGLGIDMQQALKELKLVATDANWLQNKKNLLHLKSNFSRLVHKIKRDSDLYNCEGSYCDELYVDIFNFLDAMTTSLGECHSINMGANASTALDVKIPYLSKNLNYSFFYSWYGLKKTYPERKNTAFEALKAFTTHNFHPETSSCKMVSKKSATSFGQFLWAIGLAGD